MAQEREEEPHHRLEGRGGRERNVASHAVPLTDLQNPRHVKPTPLQRAYLKFIGDYVAVHQQAPAEADMEKFFQVSPPAVHRMVVALADKGLITRVPGQARSIRLVEELHEEEEPLPSRPADHLTAHLDPEIAPLVEALRSDRRIVTKGSCWGHGKKPFYVDLAVEGVEGLRVFVERLNRVDRKVTRKPFWT